MKILTNNDKITVSQTIALLITNMIGTSVLSLPSEVANIAGSDGWIIVILSGLLVLISSIAIGTLLKKFPNDTLIEISEKVLGKFSSYVIGIILIFYFTIVAGLSLRGFTEVMNAFLLPRTPRVFIIITQLLLTVYLIRHGIEPIARIAEILVPLLLIPVFAMYLIAIPRADFTELLPIFNTPVKKMVLSSITSVTSFLGFEILLIISPYMRKPEQGQRAVSISVAIIILFYLFIVIIVFATIGVEDTSLMLWPAMSIIRTIKAPGRVFERLDALALALWSIAAFTTINGYYYSAVISCAHIKKNREFKMYVAILFPWIYFISMLPRNVLESSAWLAKLGIFGTIPALIIPVLVLLINAFTKKDKKTA